MKIIRFPIQATGDETVFEISFKDSEIITSRSSEAETICRKLYEKTQKISDGIMYLSEVAKRIED